MKGIMFITTTIGSVIGAYIPSLWGDNNGLSLTSILLGGVGGIIGVWAGWKIANELEV